jgi:hypothetical protein
MLAVAVLTLSRGPGSNSERITSPCSYPPLTEVGRNGRIGSIASATASGSTSATMTSALIPENDVRFSH